MTIIPVDDLIELLVLSPLEAQICYIFYRTITVSLYDLDIAMLCPFKKPLSLGLKNQKCI